MAERESHENHEKPFPLDFKTTADGLRPSLQDMQDFQGLGKNTKTEINPCEPDSVVFTDNAGFSIIHPSQSRLEKDSQARDSLNANQPEKTASESEKKEAQEGLRKIDDYLSSAGNDRDREQEVGDKMTEYFSSIDPKAADGILSEMNKSLEPKGMRAARTPSGEFWLGKKTEDGTYSPTVELGKQDHCAMS